MRSFTMTIGGEPRAGSGTFEVIDPATGTSFAHAPECSPEDLNRAMGAADAAFPLWKKDEGARRDALVAAADALQADAQSLARLLTEEQGKPLNHAMREVMSASAIFRLTAAQKIPVEIVHKDEHSRIEVHRRPFGVVAAITPWNFPILIAAAKLAPALLAGNTVVLKPSPFTPLSTLAMGTLLRAAFPRGVLNVVSGGDDLGQRMTEHPLVRKVSFTGSVATGKKVASTAAPDLKRVTLELGGNDPAIVLADVDPKKIAHALFWGAFTNSGQVCTAIKRMYVAEPVYDAVVEAVSAVARAVKVGPGLDPGVELGPVNNAPQDRRVRDLLIDARTRGATVRTGGERPQGGGYFFDPAVLTDVEDDARVVAEEQFGPVLPIMHFSRLDDALERANATHFGLSASVWTADPERGAAIAAEIDCGTAWVNQHIALSPIAPFGGAKSSGIGYTSGRWGLDAYCQLQVLNVRTKERAAGSA